MDFLGHRIDARGICLVNDKVTAIREFPVPTTLAGVRQFTGMVNHYRRFVSYCTDILQPLSDLRGRTNGHVELPPDAAAAFE